MISILSHYYFFLHTMTTEYILLYQLLWSTIICTSLPCLLTYLIKLYVFIVQWPHSSVCRHCRRPPTCTSVMCWRPFVRISASLLGCLHPRKKRCCLPLTSRDVTLSCAETEPTMSALWRPHMWECPSLTILTSRGRSKGWETPPLYPLQQLGRRLDPRMQRGPPPKTERLVPHHITYIVYIYLIIRSGQSSCRAAGTGGGPHYR